VAVAVAAARGAAAGTQIGRDRVIDGLFFTSCGFGDHARDLAADVAVPGLPGIGRTPLAAVSVRRGW
jgi:hypothetical protein